MMLRWRSSPIVVRRLLSAPGGIAGCQCARIRINATSSVGGRPFCILPSNSERCIAVVVDAARRVGSRAGRAVKKSC